MSRDNVYYWPLWLSQLLSPSQQNKIKNVLPCLQRGQDFLWQALNIYDDFFDEGGERQKLPLANSYFRRYLEIHYRLNLGSDYYRLLSRLMNNLEKANLNEITTPKLKRKNGKIIIPAKLPSGVSPVRLEQKSLVLALGPIALLFFLGYKMSDKKIKSSLIFFKYALAAKQLADDSHDWQEDLKNGLITFSNRSILQAARKQKLKIDLKKRPEIANLLFVQEASPLIIYQLQKLCHAARREMAKIDKNPENILLKNLISPLEKSCSKAREFQSLVV